MADLDDEISLCRAAFVAPRSPRSRLLAASCGSTDGLAWSRDDIGRAHRAGLAAEAALAFAAGAATFWFAGAALAGLHSDPVVALLGAVFVVVLIAVARTLGVAYAVPVGMAGILAYDWFDVATHAYEFPDAANLVELIIYVGAGVLIGQVGRTRFAARNAPRAHGPR